MERKTTITLNLNDIIDIIADEYFVDPDDVQIYIQGGTVFAEVTGEDL